MVEKRREMRGVRLTEEAHRGIDALVTRAGCTRTGFFEALGLAARSGSPIVWEQVIAEAIRIDRSRLSRR